MLRRLLAVVMLVGTTVALADDKVVSPEPEYECKFEDGSVVRMTLGVSAVTVKTKYGPMVVPLAEARKLEMGFRYPDGVEAKVRRAVDDLGSPDFRTREAAQKVLTDFGEYAVPLVKAGTQSTTPEVASRCVAILKAVTATLPDDKSDPVMDDVITTDDMIIRGKITTDSFRAKSTYFGETPVKLIHVRELRPVGPRFVGTFTLDAGKYAATGWKTFFDTGLDVEKGQPLEISAAGTIDLQPKTPKQTTCGPDGGGTQVAGPGQHFPEEKVIGGLGPGGPPNAYGYGPVYTSGALYWRVGKSGPLFKIGEKVTVPKASDPGRLYLIIAPSTFGESGGEYAVKVRLGK